MSTSNLSTLLLLSTIIAELAVKVPGVWSSMSAKYLPPITSTLLSAGLPTNNRDPLLLLVPEPPVYANSPALRLPGAEVPVDLLILIVVAILFLYRSQKLPASTISMSPVACAKTTNSKLFVDVSR